MDHRELLAELERRGLRLSVRDVGPPVDRYAPLTPELIAEIRSNRSALIRAVALREALGVFPDARVISREEADEQLEWARGRCAYPLPRSLFAAKLAREGQTGIRIPSFCPPAPPSGPRCAGCHEPGPFEPGAFCFACELGLEHAGADPLKVRIALELRDAKGPANQRGIRQAEVTKQAEARRKERVRAQARERAQARRAEKTHNQSEEYA